MKFPSLEMLICLARELEVSLDYLISSDQNHSNADELDEIHLLLSWCSSEETAFLTDVMASIRDDLKKHGFHTGDSKGEFS